MENNQNRKDQAALFRKYTERREFNPVLWAFQKKLFNSQRYVLNVILLALAIILAWYNRENQVMPDAAASVISGVLVLMAILVRVAFEWERVPILRLGKYHRTKGPGVFFVIPVIENIMDYMECRIRVTDFSAENVLTKDSVPVFVDAIIFWMVWDAAKASLEVENYKNAVALSAKTALRDIIGKNALSTLLINRDDIGNQLQAILDAKTNPWGVTSQSVEIKDITIPSELEDAMSREAQSERERNARLLLGDAEILLSEQYAKASEKYKGNETALSLRSLNLLVEALNKKGSMILVPSETPHLMNKALSMAMARQSKSGGDESVE